MLPRSFLNTLQALHDGYKSVNKYNIDLRNPVLTGELSYEEQKKGSIVRLIPARVKTLQNEFLKLETQYKTKDNEDVLLQMRVLLGELKKNQTSIVDAKRILEAIAQGASELKISQTNNTIAAPMNNIPHEVRGEINTDIAEIQKTFNSGCYRSCMILCGRVLEVALHRKYFDATGHDVLEKSPGIGLGTLLAKMREKDLFFDPGLMNQIHLINMTRIFCVHKKQEPFITSKEQTQATIIYTLDVLKKLF